MFSERGGGGGGICASAESIDLGQPAQTDQDLVRLVNFLHRKDQITS